MRSLTKIIVALLLLITTTANAQTWQWAQKLESVSSADAVTVKGIDVDGSGNTYVTGRFNGSVTAPNGTIVSSGQDAFVAKFDNSGALQWFYKGGGDGDDGSNGISVETFGTGAFYITGYVNYHETVWNVVFNGTSSSVTLPASSVGPSYAAPLWNYGMGAKQIFVAKYSSAGVLQWVAPVYSYLDTTSSTGQRAPEESEGLAIVAGYKYPGSTDRNVYVTGFCGGGYSDFPGLGRVVGGNPAYADPHGFVARFNTSGTATWVKVILGGPTTTSFATSITIDRNLTNVNGTGSARGNLYITGDYTGATDVCGVPMSTVSGYQKGYVARLNPTNGVAAWAQEISSNNGDVTAHDIATTEFGADVFITGDFAGTSLSLSGMPMAATGDKDIYVYRLDRNTAMVGSVKIEGGIHDQYANSIAVLGNGYVQVAGVYNQTINLSGNSRNTVNAGIFENDHFMVTYDNSLNYICAANWDADMLFSPFWADITLDAVDVCASKTDNTSYYAGMYFSNETPNFNGLLSSPSDASYVNHWTCCDCPPPTITAISRPGVGTTATVFFSYPTCTGTGLPFILRYSNGGPMLTMPVTWGSPSIVINMLAPLIIYNWSTQNNCGAVSLITMAKQNTDVNAIAGEQKLKVYPNPANDKLGIVSETSGRFEIYDMVGQKIATSAINAGVEAWIDTKALPQGNYIGKFITNDNETSITKFEVVH